MARTQTPAAGAGAAGAGSARRSSRRRSRRRCAGRRGCSGTSSSSIEPKRRHQAVGDVARAGARCDRRFSGSTQPSTDAPVRITSIGWLAAGKLLQHRAHRGRHAAQRLQLRLVGRELRACSAACRGSAGRRSLRTRRCRRSRGCRSRGSAGRCRSAPTVHSAVLPAVTPESATDFFGLTACGSGVSFLLLLSPTVFGQNSSSSFCS